MRRSVNLRRAAWRRGQQAEERVAEVLVESGWRVVARNWCAAGGELDLVVARQGDVRFVEVRARQPGDDSGLESVGWIKQRRLIRAAEAWLQTQPEPAEAAFMVAIVGFGPLPWPVEIIDDAFDG